MLKRSADSFTRNTRQIYFSPASRTGGSFRTFHLAGFSANGPQARGSRDARAAHPRDHPISVVRFAHASRIALGLPNSANALQQRNSRRAAFHAVYMDHQLLPASRSASERPV